MYDWVKEHIMEVCVCGCVMTRHTESSGSGCAASECEMFCSSTSSFFVCGVECGVCSLQQNAEQLFLYALLLCK